MYPRDTYNPNRMAGEMPGVEQLDREIEELRRQRSDVLRAAGKIMDPKDERMVQLAYEAGEYRGLNASLKDRLKNRDERIKKLVEDVEAHSNYDDWVARARTAEAKLAKRAARRRSR